jgi:DNA-directed RNA polymerase specialized sigma24 family protein
MTDIKLSELAAANRQVVSKAAFKELQPYIRSMSRKYANELGCEPQDVEGDIYVMLLEQLDAAIARSSVSVIAYLRTAVKNSILNLARKRHNSEHRHSKLSDISETNGASSYTIDRRFDLMELTDLEYRVCLSRFNGEKRANFLASNQDISKQDYYDALKSVRGKLV